MADAKNASGKKAVQKELTASERIRRTKRFKQLKACLVDQLERSGNDKAHFLDLVNDYMEMYVTKEQCIADISERGVSIKSTGSAGQDIIKKNESVDLLIRTNAQMIKLLDKLGISADGEAPEDEAF